MSDATHSRYPNAQLGPVCSRKILFFSKNDVQAAQGQTTESIKIKRDRKQRTFAMRSIKGTFSSLFLVAFDSIFLGDVSHEAVEYEYDIFGDF